MKKKAPSKKITKPIIETDNFWEQEIEVGEIPYGDSAKHVFSVCVKEGKKYIAMSRWYKSKKDKVWVLSNKGTVLNFDELPPIFEMYIKAFEQAKTIDLEAVTLFDK